MIMLPIFGLIINIVCGVILWNSMNINKDLGNTKMYRIGIGIMVFLGFVATCNIALTIAYILGA
jgi:hypothetical protein